jgi:multiple sugar transport system ATP-binding protein
MGSVSNGRAVLELSDVITARIDPRRVPAKGQQVTVRVRPDELHLFSPGTGERLN